MATISLNVQNNGNIFTKNWKKLKFAAKCDKLFTKIFKM